MLPSQCTRTAPKQITCYQDGTSTQVRDPALPVQQDPVTENNQVQRFLQNTPKGDLPDPSTLTGPLAGASLDDEAQVYTDACDQWVITSIETASGDTTTIGAEAGVTEDDCPDMPIFFTGNDVPAATAHDAAAIVQNPAWLQPSYASGSEKPSSGRHGSWLGTDTDCADYDTSVDQCDEYPYYATDQGWPAAGEGTLSVEPILAHDNLSQGGSYGAFTTKTCTSIAASTRGTAGCNFLVIPVPLLPTWIYHCGNGTVTH